VDVDHELPKSVDLDLATPGQPTSLSEYSPAQRTWNPDEHKAKSATTVARVIVGTFAATIALVFVAAIVIMLVSRSVDEAQKYATVLIGVLDALSNFLTAVFAPLLAFVLGYYFGEKGGTK
jgi:type IV secretory pathway VirB2 component (pilin)